MKLEINKSYILFTNSNYILNKKIRVLSYMNYDRASEYASFTENVAINEKFIDSSGDADYLKKQIFYDCGVIKLEDGEWKLTGETVIVWDDIIDTDRTQRLYEDYIYKLNFKFKDIADTDIISYEDVVKTIKDAINNKYNISKTKVEFELEKINSSDLNDAEAELSNAKNVLNDAKNTLNAFISLEDSAKAINSEFSDNDILNKVNTLSSNVNTILKNTNTIIAQTS